jgi:hypothetical protein
MKIRKTVRTLTQRDARTEGHMWSPYKASLLSKERLRSVLLPFIRQPLIFTCKHSTYIEFSFSALQVCLTDTTHYIPY